MINEVIVDEKFMSIYNKNFEEYEKDCEILKQLLNNVNEIENSE